MIQCKQCGQLLDENEKDELLQALAEGIRPQIICQACIDEPDDDQQVSDDDDYECDYTDPDFGY